MRLNRLDLTRYGKFTDHVIDFGAATPGLPDLHLIYGPNEAGKSTLFNGWLDLLFGIGAQSAYNFLHPYPAMRIGASIDLESGTQEFVRIKRPQNSLLDGHDQPVSEAALLAGLSGLDRESYRTMFSLDDETLEQGGESILASRGDLGELLFSASAGLGELSQNLARIRTETEDFYKPRAQKRVLGELKAQLAALKAERDQIDTQASKYAQLNKDLEDARQRHEEASGKRKQLRTRVTAITAILSALPRRDELADLQAELETLKDLPEAAPEWRAEIAALREEQARLEAGAGAIAEELERLIAERDAVEVDSRVLSMGDRIAELDRLRTRHDTAEEDLPGRHQALNRLDGSIAQLLSRLGRDGEIEPTRLLLDAATAADLNDLIKARAGLDARIASARKEAADAKARAEEALTALPQTGDSDPAVAPEQRRSQITVLTQALGAARQEDHSARLRTAERALAVAREKHASRLAALAPWRGESAQLRAMTPPDADRIRAWKTGIEELARKAARLDEESERISQLLRRLEAERDAVTRATDLASEEEVRALRAARDQAWSDHKTKLDTETAATFEAAMQACDGAVGQRAAHQADAARLKENAIQMATARADLDSNHVAREQLDRDRSALHAAIADAIARMSAELDPQMTPAALEDWLARRELALQAEAEVNDLIGQIETAQVDRQHSCARLAQALAPLQLAIPQNENFEQLISHAEDLVSSETRLEGLRQAVATAERERKRRENELRDAEAEMQAWVLAWKDACSRSWLGSEQRMPTPAQIQETLKLLSELAPALDQRASLADRIAKMERDQESYVTKLKQLASDIGIEPEGVATAHLNQRITDQFAMAEKASDRHEDFARQIEDASARQRALSEARAVHAGRKAQMLDALAAETLAGAALRVDQALERKRLMSRTVSIGRELREALGAASLAEALAQLSDVDPLASNAEKQELEVELEILDADIQDLHADRRAAEAALAAVGGDDAVAQIEQQRQTTLIAIAEGASHYLRLSAGVLAMEQALTLYREKHRSTMMARASEAVRTISRGRYTGLASQPDKGRELLIALTEDGGSKQAEEMSKGARFQLYLALRVAGYHEFAQSRRTVPFIADDIMETFDDFRAEETFGLFAEMAGVGQVIYLTHHRHLCDIARSVCPDVRIHELSA
ncbi:AAA family ATPase [Hoeflea sp.]|uniref:ATP-binding protein n=1 Tax=Hoeflea sp. TaxID=1940281 RepID=UPI003A8F75DD